MKKALFLSLIIFGSFLSADALMNAVLSDERDPKNVLRDDARNPYETLSFFQITDEMEVVELSPGGGWYTEILANYLHKSGGLIAAHLDKDTTSIYLKKIRKNFEKKMNSNSIYQNVEIVDLSSELSEPNSVDAVLTFRNLHNCLLYTSDAADE